MRVEPLPHRFNVTFIHHTFFGQNKNYFPCFLKKVSKVTVTTSNVNSLTFYVARARALRTDIMNSSALHQCNLSIRGPSGTNLLRNTELFVLVVWPLI